MITAVLVVVVTLPLALAGPKLSLRAPEADVIRRLARAASLWRVCVLSECSAAW